MATEGCGWDTKRIMETVYEIGRSPEKRPPQLHVANDGGILVEDLMDVWGKAAGLTEKQVVEALREHVFEMRDGVPELRFSINEDLGGNIFIRVHGRRKPTRKRPPPASRSKGYGNWRGSPAIEDAYPAARSSLFAERRSRRRLLENPRFFRMREGFRYCVLCDQWADDGHLQGRRHTKRAAHPEWYLDDIALAPKRESKVEVVELSDDDDAPMAPAEGQKLRGMSRQELVARVQRLEEAMGVGGPAIPALAKPVATGAPDADRAAAAPGSELPHAMEQG
eukprot:TRINITY_DN19003_c0_g2_i1.p1 TRINITY_DN19003_c0_g2~~TRINITY_DN19003_c0_g2_i1.p1  ORF type:complete len:280 (-),score=50.90 TRINITY_DN19003_c0_g2_i1:103-942(-)